MMWIIPAMRGHKSEHETIFYEKELSDGRRFSEYFYGHAESLPAGAVYPAAVDCVQPSRSASVRCRGGGDLIIQISIFLAVSIVLLIFTRPWAEKHLNRKRVRTNYEREIGKVIRITEKVDNLNQTGKSVVDGQEWTVRSKNDSEIFEAGALARVAAVSGVKLIVEKCEEETV